MHDILEEIVGLPWDGCPTIFQFVRIQTWYTGDTPVTPSGTRTIPLPFSELQ